MIAPINQVERVPRRVRAFLGGKIVLDTIRAQYVWEWPFYPQYYIPLSDLAEDLLVPENKTQNSARGVVSLFGARAGGIHRPRAAKVLHAASDDRLVDTVRFEWDALDEWYEEDEQVFVHPRNPYVRVDAVRSSRTIRVEMHDVVLATSSSLVMVFETGLTTRYYLPRTDVNFEHLVATDTVTSCPYKGKTSGYWSIQIGDEIHKDLVWAYDFPTYQLTPIAGLISFYNEKVDIFLDGESLERPKTHFFRSDN